MTEGVGYSNAAEKKIMVNIQYDGKQILGYPKS